LDERQKTKDSDQTKANLPKLYYKHIQLTTSSLNLTKNKSNKTRLHDKSHKPRNDDCSVCVVSMTCNKPTLSVMRDDSCSTAADRQQLVYCFQSAGQTNGHIALKYRAQLYNRTRWSRPAWLVGV